MHIRHTLLNAAVLAALASAGAASAAPPSNSPYYLDAQESHVEDATSRGIEQVNMITCIVNAMRPDALVNDGDYIALIDQQKCDPRARASDTSSAGASDAAQAPTYMTAIVRSTRTSNAEPMRVRTWIEESGENGEPATIFVNTSASAPPSAQTPYGVFRLDYCGRGENAPECLMRGYLEGALDGLSYFEIEPGENRPGTKALRLTSVGAESGSGRMKFDSKWEELEFNFAYDQDHFLRSDGQGPQCFARDASDPDTGMSVWRYGLYDAATGARVARNSGFPIEYSANGKTHHGYLSYWGLSLSPEAGDAPNGATVHKVDYASGDASVRTAYTLVRTGGKLVKYTKHSRTLAEIDKIRFNTWIGDASGLFPGAASNSQYVLYWNDDADEFRAVARMECIPGRCETIDLEQEESIPFTFWTAQGGVRGWSEALGGELFIDLRDVSGALDAQQVDVFYRSQAVVYPHEAPSMLYCLRDCPTAATLSNYFAQGSALGSPFVPTSAGRFGPTSAVDVVTYGVEDGVLVDQFDGEVVMNDTELMQARPAYQWGVRTGRLFTELQSAQCAAQPGSYCESQVDALEVYYAWETGAGQWNQFAAVKDDNGTYVKFEAPLQVNFTVPAGAAYGAYAGKTLVLQYGGFGDLWGVPGHCVSRLTNAPVSCESEDSRHVPAFIIPFDEELGRATAGDETYLVKWLQREIRFARKPEPACAGLTLPTEVTLPTATDLKDPSSPESDVYIGTKPLVSGAPRVIHGEVKY